MPEQLSPLQIGFSGIGVSLLLEFSTHVLLLLGPVYLSVTGWPPGTVAADARRVTGMMISVAVTGAEAVEPALAMA
jgi:hypothetical protein